MFLQIYLIAVFRDKKSYFITVDEMFVFTFELRFCIQVVLVQNAILNYQITLTRVSEDKFRSFWTD